MVEGRKGEQAVEEAVLREGLVLEPVLAQACAASHLCSVSVQG